jgi:hypothetical protein
MPATFLSMPFTWRAWETGGTDQRPLVLHREAYATGPSRRDEVYHVFFEAVSEAERAAFQKIVDTATSP